MAREAEHQPDQLIVDLRHRKVVNEMLDGLGVKRVEEVDERLGLVRLAGLVDEGSVPVEAGELGALLRQRAAAARDGWTPTIGKNRFVDAVIGAGHKPMGGGLPRPAHDVGPLLLGDPAAGQGVRVGVVDVPVEPPPVDGPRPYRSGHGIFVTGLIKAHAPAAQLHHEGVLDPETGRADSWAVAQAIVRLATTHDLDLLNLSLGCFTMAGGPPLVIARAIERVPKRTLIIAAAGNHGGLFKLNGGRDRHSACWPAAVPGVTAIGGYGPDGLPEWNPSADWVSYLAPGVDVVGPYLSGEVRLDDGMVEEFDGHALWSGTSFAAATVTGVIAAKTRPGEAGDALAAEAGDGPIRKV